MKALKKRGYEGTIRKIANDEKSVIYGVVGTVKDLLKEGILSYCDFSPDDWCFISNDRTKEDVFGKDRQCVLDAVKTQFE